MLDLRVEDKLVRLPVDAIHPSPCQPRTKFQAASIEALSDSIRRYGLLSPVVVRVMGDGYELVAGERRLRAVKHLGQATIDAIVKPVDAREAALMTLIENIQREDLHFLEEAAAFRQMLDGYGYSQQALATRLGLSQSAVANKLRLLKLNPAVRARLTQSELTERHARALLALDEASQLEALNRAASERMSVRQLEGLIARANESKSRARYRIYPRDHRLLINTVLGAVKSLNDAGIAAAGRVEHLEDRIEVVVTLPL